MPATLNLSSDLSYFADRPEELKAILWPHVRFYKKQWDVIYSVRDNDETYCYAAHQMGKDYVAGFIVLWYFLSHPVVRVVTTSVKDDHLRVLWGEIGRYIDTSLIPLSDKGKGGAPCPLTTRLIVTHREIRKQTLVQLSDVAAGSANPLPGRRPNPSSPLSGGADNPASWWVTCKISYVRGMVSEKGEGMAGHHAPKTLLVIDEASGVDEMVPERASSWAKKSYVFGNPYGTGHWFHQVCKGGDVPYKAAEVGK